MSTITPAEVTYKWAAEVDTGTVWLPLDVSNIVPSMDMDRSPFCQVTLTLQNVTETVWAALDPRAEHALGFGPLRFKAWCEDVDGNLLSWVGRWGGDTSPWWLYVWIQTADRDLITGEATVVCADDESRLNDKRRIATGGIDTGATTLSGLVMWALLDVFGGVTTTADPLALTTAIPAGDRRVMQPGETFTELIMPELQAIDYRTYNYWGRIWAIYQREHTPKWTGASPTVELATYEHDEGAPAFTDPIVFAMTEQISRTGDWANGVLVRYDMTSYGGAVTVQRSGDGVHTKGRVITYQRPAPAGHAADTIVQRTRIRGRELTVEARARFDVVPGQTVSIYTRDSRPAGSLRSVEWDCAKGTMTLTIQTGLPVD